jgi:hypothetical protein
MMMTNENLSYDEIVQSSEKKMKEDISKYNKAITDELENLKSYLNDETKRINDKFENFESSLSMISRDIEKVWAQKLSDFAAICVQSQKLKDEMILRFRIIREDLKNSFGKNYNPRTNPLELKNTENLALTPKLCKFTNLSSIKSVVFQIQAKPKVIEQPFNTAPVFYNNIRPPSEERFMLGKKHKADEIRVEISKGAKPKTNIIITKFRPKKCLNPYFNFVKLNRLNFKKNNPKFTYFELSKIMSEVWRKMNDISKQQYYNMSRLEKSKHEKEMKSHEEVVGEIVNFFKKDKSVISDEFEESESNEYGVDENKQDEKDEEDQGSLKCQYYYDESRENEVEDFVNNKKDEDIVFSEYYDESGEYEVEEYEMDEKNKLSPYYELPDDLSEYEVEEKDED